MRAQIVFPSLPRNPVLRALALIGGLAVVAALVAVGFVVGAAVLAVAAAVLAIQRWRRGRAARNVESSIIEGEFKVAPGTLPLIDQRGGKS